MNLESFSVPREVFAIINRVSADEEQDKLIYAVLRYIYDDDDRPSRGLRYQVAIDAFDSITKLIDKALARARKAKARRDDRKAHPKKYPPRRKPGVRRAGAIELPSGHIIKSPHTRNAAFDYYCIRNNKVMYFRMIGSGEIEGHTASFVPEYSPDNVISTLMKPLSNNRFLGLRT